ncbi:MAG: hypothetical protein NVSMB6_13970 [Burkholderiaceae bacterium]
MNPAERVWRQLQCRHPANYCYDGCEQIIDVLCHVWNTFTPIPGAIGSLCTRQWRELDTTVITSGRGIGLTSCA